MTNDKMKIERKLSKNIILFLIVGNIFIGFGIGALRIAALGCDPYTGMNLSVSNVLGILFGTWNLIMNIAILLILLFTMRERLGIGTIINMVCCGYIADLLCWILQDVIKMPQTWPVRIIFLILGQVGIGLGAAMYMLTNLGSSPYDSVGYLVAKIARNKISYGTGRVISDVTCVIVAIIVSLVSGQKVWELIGAGTVINALACGPMIQFFSDRLKQYVA